MTLQCGLFERSARRGVRSEQVAVFPGLRKTSLMRRILAIFLCAGLAISVSATDGSGAAVAAPTKPITSSYVTKQYQRNRSDAFLRYATQTLSPSSITNVVAHAERARRDPSFAFDSAAVTPAAFQASFDRLDGFKDTSDFTMLYLTNLWHGYRDMLRPDTVAAIEQRFIAFKYWFTDPQPPGVIDDRYYWSENHRIIFYTIEHLAGQAFSTTTFTNDGNSGAYHRDRGRDEILKWIDEKVKFGFTEWHSDVYYQEDLTPLLTLVEFSNDPVIRKRAAMLLDMLLVDIALHLRQNNFGATHGRSYMKDKSKAADQDTFNATKLLFDLTPNDYTSASDAGAVLLSRAQKYRLPQVIWNIARSRRTMVDQQHMGVAINPEAPVTPNPVAPVGYEFDKPESVPFWFERAAQTSWQEIESTIRTLDQYGLWTSQFYAPFKPLRDVVGSDMNLARLFAQSLSPQLSFAMLSEVDTYTYRSPDVMLSTAQDYRKGMHGDQHHISQATLDDTAIVFTQSPKNEPLPTVRWPDADGYFTGNGALPRAAQHGTVSVSLYAPQFVPNPVLPASLGYIDKTHAFFPTERFDEVRQQGNWTFGRKGNGYVALWSWRTPHWQQWDPAVYFTDGLTQPFDLVADGADNVWVTEVGDLRHNGSFDAFVAATAKASIDATPLPAVDGHPGGFDMSYNSPTQGAMTFGWSNPLTVKGSTVDIHRALRYDNPFVRAEVGAQRFRYRAEGSELTLDFSTNSRETKRRQRARTSTINSASGS